MAGHDKGDRIGAGSDEAICRARDIREMLDHIIARVSDADERQSEALRDMRERIEGLATKASHARTRLPERYAGDFERLEGALDALAMRLAAAEQDQQHRHAGPPVRPEPEPIVSRPRTTAPSEPRAGEPARPPSFEPQREPEGDLADLVRAEVRYAVSGAQATLAPPPALKSALASSRAAAGDWVRVEPPQASAPVIPQEPVSVPADVLPALGRDSADLDAHWTNGAAEALARHYETRTQASEAAIAAATKPAREPAALATRTVRRDRPAEPAAMTPVASSTSTGEAAGPTAIPFAAGVAATAAVMPALSAAAPAIERAWLDDRLTAVAARIEQSLTGLDSHGSFAALGQRFDLLEQRFGHALDDVVRRSDIAGLRTVEAHIGELAAQLGETQVQLRRLDTIERQIGELAHALSDVQLQRLVGELLPTEQDLTQVAETAAARVIERAGLPAAGGTSALAAPTQVIEDPRIGDIAQLLNDFVSERRRGDSQTAEALETLQHAMQHLLDRIDILEAGQAEASAQLAAAVAGSTPEHVQGEAQDRWSTGAGTAPDSRNADQDPQRAATSAGDPAHTYVHREPARAQPPNEEPDRETFGTAGGRSGRAALSRDANARAAAAGEDERSAFIAMARQAAERAGGRPEQAPVEKASGSKLRERLAKSGEEKSGGLAGLFGRSRMFSIAALGIALLAGYMVVASGRLGGEQPAELTLAGKAVLIDAPAAAEAGKAAAGDGAPAAPAASAANTDPAAAPGGERTSGVFTVGRVVEPGVGIAVEESPAPLAPGALTKARQQVEMASLSTRLGHEQARLAVATETAAARDLLTAARKSAAPGPQGAPEPAASAPARAVELPPVLVGPLSLRQAAAKGDPAAQLEVATRFAEGRGIPPDYAQAAIWYQRAATSGNPTAQYRLAALYERGLGVAADPARARLWYQRAAEGGNVRAMHNLAVLSAGRAGTSPDYPSAVQWFTEAAERGLADSQYNLGILHEAGLGVPVNRIEAYKWYALAARNGDKQAQARRDHIRKALDERSLAAADALVLSWRAKPMQLGAGDGQAANQAWKITVGSSPRQ